MHPIHSKFYAQLHCKLGCYMMIENDLIFLAMNLAFKNFEKVDWFGIRIRKVLVILDITTGLD